MILLWITLFTGFIPLFYDLIPGLICILPVGGGQIAAAGSVELFRLGIQHICDRRRGLIVLRRLLGYLRLGLLLPILSSLSILASLISSLRSLPILASLISSLRSLPSLAALLNLLSILLLLPCRGLL